MEKVITLPDSKNAIIKSMLSVLAQQVTDTPIVKPVKKHNQMRNAVRAARKRNRSK